MDAATAECCLSTLAGSAPEPGTIPCWHYARGYWLSGVGRWQRRALWLCGLMWIIGAQAVTLHIFTEAAYDACKDMCPTSSGTCEIRTPPSRGSVSYDFSLYCNNEWKSISLGILYFLPGWFFGAAVMGSASDSYGRRPALLTSLTMGVLSTFSVAAATGYWMYAVARTAMGFAFGGTGVVAYVLGCELMPADWISIIGVGFFSVYFVLGEAGIVAIATVVMGWRLLTVIVGLQVLVALPLVYWFAPESPKWLISQGRGSEAKQMLLAAAELNGSAAVSALGQLVYEDSDGSGSGGESVAERGHSAVAPAKGSLVTSAGTDSEMTSDSEATTDSAVTVRGGVLGLFSRPMMALMTVCVCFSWLTVGGVYYGINNIAGDLPGSLYTNAFVSALVEIPGTLLGNILIDIPSLGRKRSTAGLFAFAGCSCIVAEFISGGARTAVAYVGKLAISAAFATVYVYSTELFATPSRNAGMGLGSQMARVGSGIATGLVTVISVDSTMWIFATLSLVAAVLVQAVLVETFGSPLPETVDEVLARRMRQTHADNGEPTARNLTCQETEDE